MSIKIGSNIASIQAQRRLGEATSSLGKIYERLSSGQRINTASDDAAGLAIADSLRSDARLYTQAYRNINDGISILSIADSATSELTKIVTRKLELAEQAANGTYSATQRRVLDDESEALAAEFTRILESTNFNGINLFQPNSSIHIQVGIDSTSNSQITVDLSSLSLDQAVSQSVGDGTLTYAASYMAASNLLTLLSGDLNQDTYDDLVYNTINGVYVGMSNGDGTFSAPTLVKDHTGTNAQISELVDLNNDGKLDIVTSRQTTSQISVSLGVGDGTFLASTEYAAIANTAELTAGDVNNDGYADIIVAGSGNNNASLFLNQGNGTFGAASNLGNLIGGSGDIRLSDFNNDDNLDLIFYNDASNRFDLRLGDGLGSFAASSTVANVAAAYSIDIADFDNDGYQDLILEANFLTAQIMMNNRDGTFSQTGNYITDGDYTTAAIQDIDGDGYLDFFAADQTNNSVRSFYGNGNGTFNEGASYVDVANVPGGQYTVNADINGDGVQDLLVSNTSPTNIVSLTQGTITSDVVTGISLLTQESARTSIEILYASQRQLSTYQGKLGAQMSRLEVASNVTMASNENSKIAESRIRDVDIAEGSSELLRNNILQQAATAVLSQANLQPQLALTLLRNVR